MHSPSRNRNTISSQTFCENAASAANTTKPIRSIRYIVLRPSRSDTRPITSAPTNIPTIAEQLVMPEVSGVNVHDFFSTGRATAMTVRSKPSRNIPIDESRVSLRRNRDRFAMSRVAAVIAPPPYAGVRVWGSWRHLGPGVAGGAGAGAGGTSDRADAAKFSPPGDKLPLKFVILETRFRHRAAPTGARASRTGTVRTPGACRGTVEGNG